jgi:hypothetical protein
MLQPPSPPPGQLLPNGNQPYSSQGSFSWMIGRVVSENPDSAGGNAQNWINDGARIVYDRRNWHGLLIKGQVLSPQVYNQGTATLTYNSQAVTGTGTGWTTAPVSLVGQQLRVGFNTPIYTITAVNSDTSLTLDQPWGWNSGTYGYFVAQYYYNLGGNIKYVYEMKNLLLGYRMWTNLNQRTLDSSDPWRAQQFSPYGIAPLPPDQSGNYMIEMYPVPIIQQGFPYMAYIQPPNLIKDPDNLPPFIRADIVVKYAIAQALQWRGPKKNPYYDFTRSQTLMKEFNAELEQMARADENLYRNDVQWQSEQLPVFQPGGAFWQASHLSPATMGGWGFGSGDWGW